MTGSGRSRGWLEGRREEKERENERRERERERKKKWGERKGEDRKRKEKSKGVWVLKLDFIVFSIFLKEILFLVF